MEKNKIKQKLVKNLIEGIGSLAKAPAPAPAPVPNPKGPSSMAMGTEPKVKAKETVVTFDKSTSPFEVKFSERGFEINGTRLSFELIETVLSKDINITLDKGKGVVLDSVKMDKILKYKDLYARM